MIVLTKGGDYVRRTIKTSRRNSGNKRENLTYSERRKKNYEYKTGLRKNGIEVNSERRRSGRQDYNEKEQINFFALKSVICAFGILAVISISSSDFGFNNNIKDEIKAALSENISYENIGGIVDSIETLFIKNNSDSDKYSEEYTNSDFRIDENIIEQMNNEEDVYYNRQQSNSEN